MSTTTPQKENIGAVAADLQDERLLQSQGFGGRVKAELGRLRGGDLGSLPVVVGLIVIWIVFQSLNSNFLSPGNLVNLLLQSAAVGTISVGIVLVLLLGEIDLSVGSVSGVSAAMLAVGFVNHGWPIAVAIVAAIAAGAVIGLFYGLLYTRFGVPSFVITLAGLLGFLGLQLWILGADGSINIPFDSWFVRFCQQMFLTPVASYIIAAAATVVYVLASLARRNQRAKAGLSAQSFVEIGVRAGLALVVACVAIAYLNSGEGRTQGRGIGYMVVLFVAIVVLMNLVLRRTRWGRSVFAVGGNVEAARRAGIKVNRVFISVFVLCSSLAAVGGLLAAGRIANANQSSGTGDTNLNAIAAAVIGGTSLFGGRGSAYSALLGILVIQSISSGLNLLNLDSSVRYMITGAVLLLAVIIDSVSRRSRKSAGRG
ncbi:sugar ABC transporter permease [Luteimicrobium subarcticum]|uniref:Xylose transport system permease protein XylH n=1 Tax=Luteimicrobium subarcticum TaxID=620910 RepID=A0A2M8WV25_9MICO|nr:ABC transporter permease [Luteimicrobium subarcticum]PJI94785.1 simple sugar transport system permease protein/D-xylose transport system permease protein [Luteimicrobium subarcticum]